MIKIPLELYSKTYWLSPYTSVQEKDILIMLSFEVTDIDKYLDILGFNDYADLTLIEKKIILWKIREISLGNEVNIKYTCDCSQVVETILQADDFIVNGIRSDSSIKKLNMEVTDETLHKFIDIDQEALDDLVLDRYESLMEVVKQNQPEISFIRKAKCPSCNKEKPFDMSSTEYILDSLSDENLSSIYKVYSHLTYYGKYTKEDIDKMYPFERTIFIGLLHSIINEK